MFVEHNNRFRNPWSIERYLIGKWQVGSLFDCYFKYCNQEWMQTRGKRYYLDQVARVRHAVPKESGRLLEFDVQGRLAAIVWVFG